MTWLCAHLVFVVELMEGKQDQFPLLEQVYLLDVQSRESLFEKVKAIAELEQSDDGLTLDNAPARTRFLGLRRVATIANFFTGAADEVPPTDMSLLTDFRYSINSAAEGALFASGEDIQLRTADGDWEGSEEFDAWYKS